MAVKIIAYETIIHGIHHEQYFQGCGTSFTPFLASVTGIGNDAAEAYEDCLEQIASNGVEDYSLLPEQLEMEWKTMGHFLTESHTEDHHVYVSIRYNIEEVSNASVQ